MNEQELRDIVFSMVREHGPEVARQMLYARADTDFEFMLAAAKHGHAIVQAMHEASGATLH